LSYVTFTEYTKFGYKELEKNEFDHLIAKSCDYLDGMTNNYYLYNDIKADTNKFRVTKFKKACCVMTELMFATGWGTTQEDGVSDDSGWRIGETSWLPPTKSASATTAELSSGNASVVTLDNVYIILSGTGLLSRGLTAINAIGG
jgi:hypothetical protein